MTDPVGQTISKWTYLPKLPNISNIKVKLTSNLPRRAWRRGPKQIENAAEVFFRRMMLQRWIIRKRERGRWRVVVTLEEREVSLPGGHERVGEVRGPPQGHERGVDGARTRGGSQSFRRVSGLGF